MIELRDWIVLIDILKILHYRNATWNMYFQNWETTAVLLLRISKLIFLVDVYVASKFQKDINVDVWSPSWFSANTT